MIKNIDDILSAEEFSREEIIQLLSCNDNEGQGKLLKKAYEVKEKHKGKKVWLRGLIEYSNRCRKNCLYCGIGCNNNKVKRYTIPDDEVFNAVDFAYKNNYGSIVLQSGERNDKEFIDHIDFLLKEIKRRTGNSIGITLSCGEQTLTTYQRWFSSGAHRYLLRIEASDKALYNIIHPNDENHSYEKRLGALRDLKKVGYKVGTGVMIGLPFQSIENLADDLLFFKKMGVNMVGMGPYVEHKDTKLYDYNDFLLTPEERFRLSLRMIAVLRIMMKDINIASATALQALDPMGREKALKAGANIIMPNITPTAYKENYLLYDGKPCIKENANECNGCLEARIGMVGEDIAFGEWGDSPSPQ